METKKNERPNELLSQSFPSAQILCCKGAPAAVCYNSTPLHAHIFTLGMPPFHLPLSPSGSGRSQGKGDLVKALTSFGENSCSGRQPKAMIAAATYDAALRALGIC